jgi:hypothetical protein
LPGTAEPGWTTAAEAWRDVYEALSADARQKMSSVYPVADAMALAKFAAFLWPGPASETLLSCVLDPADVNYERDPFVDWYSLPRDERRSA